MGFTLSWLTVVITTKRKGIRLPKSLFGFFCKMLWKNLNELWPSYFSWSFKLSKITNLNNLCLIYLSLAFFIPFWHHRSSVFLDYSSWFSFLCLYPLLVLSFDGKDCSSPILDVCHSARHVACCVMDVYSALHTGYLTAGSKCPPHSPETPLTTQCICVMVHVL